MCVHKYVYMLVFMCVLMCMHECGSPGVLSQQPFVLCFSEALGISCLLLPSTGLQMCPSFYVGVGDAALVLRLLGQTGY